MARVNLYVEEFDTLIDNRGIDAQWQRACVCHCITSDSGQPDFTCKTCGGSGFRYLHPRNIRIAVTNLTGMLELNSLEFREQGTAYITPKSDVIMGYHDRLIFPDFKCLFSEPLRFTNSSGLSEPTFRNMLGVVFMADENWEFEQNTDYKITEDKHHIQIINKDLLKKIQGKTLSLLYYTTPAYIVTDLLHELRATLSDRKVESLTFKELPKQYQIKRENFVYNVQEPDTTKTFEPVDTGDGVEI